jgi:hypothetical protein
MQKSREAIDNQQQQSMGLQTMSDSPEPMDLPAIISSLYQPVHNSWEADDLITIHDLLESIMPLCVASNEFVFMTMNEMGFLSKNVEGTLCYFVKTN